MKIKEILILFLVVSITSCAYDLDDRLTNITVKAEDVIPVDSDLFKTIEGVTDTSGDDQKGIACIDFNYPLTIFSLDEDLVVFSVNTVSNDEEFSNLIGSLDETFSISISFPISSTLENGEPFEINTKEELKEAIDNCLQEELIFECEQLIQHCIWKIGYSFENNNDFLGYYFNEFNGATVLNISDSLYIGSWTPFTIETELHLNINLLDDTEVGSYFNKDWKVKYLDSNSLRLTYEDDVLILNQRCDDDYLECTNFNFEVCDPENENGISQFTLEDYTYCILDTIEIESNAEVSFHLSIEDAEAAENLIPTDTPFTSTVNHQIIYVRIINPENDSIHYAEIMLSVITEC